LTRLQIREGYKSRNEKSSPRKIIIWARKKGLSGYWRGYKLEGVDGPSSCVDRAQGRPPNPPPKKGGLQIREKKNRNGNSERNVRRRYFRALSPPCRAGGHLTTGISAFAPPKRIYPSFQYGCQAIRFLRLGFSERILSAPNFLRPITTLQTLAPSRFFFRLQIEAVNYSQPWATRRFLSGGIQTDPDSLRALGRTVCAVIPKKEFPSLILFLWM